MGLYKQGTLKKKDLEGLVFRLVLENPRRFYLANWEKDRRADYLCWVYPRLSASIDTYRDTGASFESYLASLLFWSAREYRVRETEHRLTERSCWEEKSREAAVCEEGSGYAEVAERPPGYKTGKKISRKEILILLLKSYSFVSEELLERAASAAGTDAGKVRGMIGALKKMREGHDERIRELKIRIHSQYYRRVSFEKRMLSAAEGSAYYAEMGEKAERAGERLANMKERLSRLRQGASNRQVGEILGIPKGTVDSALYSVKKRFGVE
jgi:hypothetical protein